MKRLLFLLLILTMLVFSGCSQVAMEHSISEYKLVTNRSMVIRSREELIDTVDKINWNERAESVGDIEWEKNQAEAILSVYDEEYFKDKALITTRIHESAHIDYLKINKDGSETINLSFTADSSELNKYTFVLLEVNQSDIVNITSVRVSEAYDLYIVFSIITLFIIMGTIYIFTKRSHKTADILNFHKRTAYIYVKHN